MKKNQTLSCGIIIRQNYRDAVRLVLFETGCAGYEYATYGGTAFVVNYSGKIYALTCGHVFQDFEHHQLVITDTKYAQKGSKLAAVKGICHPVLMNDEASGTDIGDVYVIEFVDGVDANFFQGSAYIFDANTVVTGQKGHRLSVAGVLKDKCEITEPHIQAGYCQLEFLDNGPTIFDPLLRHAIAIFSEPNFDNLAGLSGSPVYNETVNALCGMVVRGGVAGSRSQIYYVDAFDIMKLIESVHTSAPHVSYKKYLKQEFMAARGFPLSRG
jgi:hypothetical protein